MQSDNPKKVDDRNTRANNRYFMGLFEWGSTPRETEAAAEEYMFFSDKLDLAEDQEHKDHRWQQFKAAGKKGEDENSPR